MRRMKWKNLLIGTAALAVMAGAPMIGGAVSSAGVAYAAEESAATVVASGNCGKAVDDDGNEVVSNSVTWSLDSDGVLTISGSGEMYDYAKIITDGYIEDGYNREPSPWEDLTVESVVISDGVTHIGSGAFERDESITSVTIASTVTSIGFGAFWSCNGLTSIEIPDSVTSIGMNAFTACSSLSDIRLGEGIESIGVSAFSSCEKLTSVTLPESVTSIGREAFDECSCSLELTIKNKTLDLDNLFTDYFNSISICGYKESTTWEAAKEYNILFRDIDSGKYTGDCSKTDEDSVIWTLDSDGILTISGSGAMADYIDTEPQWKAAIDKVVGIVIEGTVISVGDGAFYSIFDNYENLKSITISEGVESIGAEAFNGCSYVSSVSLPSSLTTIGKSAFSGCSYVSSISLPNSLMTIGAYAFCNCGLTSIVIPGSVKKISYEAFGGCDELGNVTIQDGVESIGDRAFSNCGDLEKISIPYTVTAINEDAFQNDMYVVIIGSAGSTAETYAEKNSYKFKVYGSDSDEEDTYSGTCGENLTWNLSADRTLTISGTGVMTDYIESVNAIGDVCFNEDSVPWNGLLVKKVVISDGVTHIGSGAFYQCDRLTSVEISKDVTSIGDCAFDCCYRLTSIEIPTGVASIGKFAFSSCGLTSIEIPTGVTSIGEGAFSSYSLESISVQDDSPYYRAEEGNFLIEKNTDTLIAAVVRGLTSITIPDSVKIIGSSVFVGYNDLTSITIPDGVTSIGEYAFYDCSSLTSIEIPSGVTSIGEYAFYYCSRLTSIEIPSGVTSIGEGTFYYCSSLTSIEIPSGVTSIGDSAFMECSSLTSIDIPDSVTSIGEYAFYNCSRLTSIEIPSDVTSIGERTFYNCRGLTSIDIPDSVTSIGERTFYNCRGLTSITIPDSVTSIGEYAFQGCSGLISIDIPESVTSIGDSAFYDCSGLTSVTVSSATTEIYDDKYTMGVAGTTKIIGHSDSTAKTYAKKYGYTFESCDEPATSGTCGENVTWSLSDDGVLTISGTGAMTDYTSVGEDGSTVFESTPWSNLTVKEVVISEGVTHIGSGAFVTGNSSLAAVTIASTVESIGNSAFSDCDALTAVTIPTGVKTIGSCAFYNCDNLATVTLSEGVTSIGDSAFCACKLTTVAIPDTVTSIGGYAFGANANLTTATIPASVTEIGEQIFVDCSSSLSVTVEAGSAAETYVKNSGYAYTSVSSGDMGDDKKDDTKDDTSSDTKKDNTSGGNSGTQQPETPQTPATTPQTNTQPQATTTQVTLATPTVKAAVQAKGVKLTWNKISNATGYIVYRKLSGAKSWTKLATINKASTVSYTDKSAKSGKVYQYTVKATNGSVTSGEKASSAIRYLKAPTKVKASKKSNGIKVTWTKTKGAKGYIVYRKTGKGKWVKVKTVKSAKTVTYLDKKAKKGKKYTYKVKAYYGKSYSAEKTSKAVKR